MSGWRGSPRPARSPPNERREDRRLMTSRQPADGGATGGAYIAVRAVREVSALSAGRFLVALSDRASIGWGRLPNSDSYASCATGIAASEGRSREPVPRQAAGRAARRLAQPFGLGSTMHRARTGGATQQNAYITMVL